MEMKARRCWIGLILGSVVVVIAGAASNQNSEPKGREWVEQTQSKLTGRVLSTSGPLLVKDLNPEELDYDNYWDDDVTAHLSEFVLLSKVEYQELLKRTGFFVQESQRSIFDETNRAKSLRKKRKQK